MTVELLLAPLALDDGTLASFEASLSPGEHARAETLRDARLRRRYVADHGWRRRVLGERLGCAPADVAYAVGPRGKPEPAGGALRFSASRTGDTALYAVSGSPDAEVGVDVEEIRDPANLAGIVQRVLSAAERAALERVPDGERAAAVFACWTRKEAYLKALGTGLVFPLTELELWAGDDRPVLCGEVEVRSVDAGPGCAAAVAVRAGAGGRVSIPASPRRLA